MRGKILIQNQGGQKHKIKVRYLGVAVGVMLWSALAGRVVEAVACPDVRVVFARGSGAERNTSGDYVSFKSTIEEKLETTRLKYEFVDLDYPAVGVGFGDIETALTTLGALFGGGEAYEFGASVRKGVEKLQQMTLDVSCPETKYVLGGYSQGAIVVMNAMSGIAPEKLIYVATFGDPKIYLPEGEGAIPAACKGENLSDYRMYVPDCQAYKGMLGAHIPYEPIAYIGKVGTWCNKRDVFCSSHLNVRDHVSYEVDGLYEDASKVIFDKICQTFGIKNTISSPHDTAILIDSTQSMEELFDKYRDEAMRLAERTLATGGRVALYDYRDYQEGYVPKQRCSFKTCNMETFAMGLSAIMVEGGGDVPESLMASSLHVMQELEWKQGSTKSIVVLTDSGYHDPDYDIGGTTRLDVVRMSKQIDPVNFYVVTTPESVQSYTWLTTETGGRAVTTADDLTELSDYIIQRYDTLPRVEEEDTVATLPILKVTSVEQNNGQVKVQFTNTGSRALVILNDAILGVTDGGEVVINEVDPTVENTVTLIPLGDDVKGEGVIVQLQGDGYSYGEFDKTDGDKYSKSDEKASLNSYEWVIQDAEVGSLMWVPKAPDTGRH